MSSDLTFITNEKNRRLLDRFNALIKDTKIFDVLVGYFYTSGFHMLYKSLEKTEKIRILIGISTSRDTAKLIHDTLQKKQSTLQFSHAEVSQHFENAVSNEMENSEDDPSIEEGVLKFIEWLKNGKLEIKAYPTENIHAKLYIMTFKKDDRDVGRVITGSSNFTQAGLRDNLEFNVELKNSADYNFALKMFNELWQSAVDVKDKYIEAINSKTWLNDTITPYELYLKFLYEYFKEKINEDMDTIYKDRRFLPTGFLELEYQDDAVKDALAKLGDYGGVFLADVVGLGKTYVSALLAQQLDGYKLIICPPVLTEYWHDTFRDFGVPGFEVESLGKLDKILEKGVERYKTIFIDEAHRFRNETSQTYEKLKQICWGKRIVLVSATPLNNTPFDILSQIKLFQKGHNSTIPNVRDLDKFFGRLFKKQKSVDRKNLKAYIKVVKENSYEIRENILKYLMVRRTRSEVLKYFNKDLDKQKVHFPTLAKPERVYYKFDSQLDKAFFKTIELIKSFSYTRYMPLLYLKNPDPQELIGQRNLGRFMKILLIKRLESSFYAFKQTLHRFINSYESFIDMLESGTVYISKKYSEKIYEALENDDEDKVMQLVEQEKVQKYITKDFQKSFKQKLEQDLFVLQKIKKIWDGITLDPKLDAFKTILKNDSILKKNKLIVFTESKETAEYLDKNLKQSFGTQVLSYSSKSSATVRDRIIENYNPLHKNPKNDIKILVTTDILSEGVNMHRSNVVINYDIPWNPTKVLQRVGRINRIGTIHKQIHVYNFFPTIQSNNEIKLEEAAVAKIQAFHDTLGEDAQYLTDGEEIASHELFNRINSRKVLEDGVEQKEDSELEYLKEIRDVRDNNPSLYERIKRLPKKARSAKLYKDGPISLITFFRKNKLRKIYLVSSKKDVQDIDFFKAVGLLKSSKSEKRQKIIKDFYRYLVTNKEAFHLATTEQVREFKQSGGRSNETALIRTIKTIINFTGFTDDDEEYLTKVLKAIEDGTLSKQTMKVLVKNIKGENNPLKILFKFKQGIPDSFFAESGAGSPYYATAPKEVILSELLINVKSK